MIAAIPSGQKQKIHVSHAIAAWLGGGTCWTTPEVTPYPGWVTITVWAAVVPYKYTKIRGGNIDTSICLEIVHQIENGELAKRPSLWSFHLAKYCKLKWAVLNPFSKKKNFFSKLYLSTIWASWVYSYKSLICNCLMVKKYDHKWGMEK